MTPISNLPELGLPKVVIVGAGFAGLKLARSLRNSSFQVILLDKNNYHQFQPLFYQVATAGLDASEPLSEPSSSIHDPSFPVYRHPRKNWRVKQKAMPQWFKARAGVRTRTQSGAARVARFRPRSISAPR